MHTIFFGLFPKLVDELRELGIGQVEAGERDPVDNLQVGVMQHD